MLESDVNLLFSIAYSLDSRKRIKGMKVGEESQLLTVFTHEELEKLASDLRIMAQRNEGSPELRRENARHKGHRTVPSVPSGS